MPETEKLVINTGPLLALIVLNYMEFLLKKYKGTESKAKKFRFDWEEGLSEIREKFTSVELQHRVLEWR